jgi:hypothetical protein
MCESRSDAGGVSAGWSFEDGWLPGYPETTGYIIETFIDAAKALKRPDLIGRASRMIDWELSPPACGWRLSWTLRRARQQARVETNTP